MKRTAKTVLKMAGKTLLAIPPLAEARELSEKMRREYLTAESYSELVKTVPDLVVIVNEAPDRKNEERRGMVGWTENPLKLETLCLYDEYVPQSGLNFVPQVQCDTAYFVHPYDRKTFIRVDDYYEYCMQERLAELSNIAYCLGARKYTVEMTWESCSKSRRRNDETFSVSLGGRKGRESKNACFLGVKSASEYGREQSVEQNQRMLSRAEFVESRKPSAPELLWFKDDNRLKTQIENICEGKSTPKEIMLEFYGRQNKTMSMTATANLSATLKKINASLAAKIIKEAAEEDTRTILFHLEF